MALSTEYCNVRRNLVVASALVLFSLHVISFGQDAPGPVKESASEFPPLEVGRPLPEPWLQQFKNENLRNWVRANVVCQRQLLGYDRFGIGATDQLNITPEVFNGRTLNDKQRINLLAFELGKVFYHRIVEGTSRMGVVSSFIKAEMQVAEYKGVNLHGFGAKSSPHSLEIGDLAEPDSMFGYVFRVVLLDMTSDETAWKETLKTFHTVVDPVVKTASLPDNRTSLEDWLNETQQLAQYVETMDVMQGRAYRWKALEQWTHSACDYMTQANVSIYFPEAARDDAELVKAYRTYLLNNLVVLDDEEIASGLASSGVSLSSCEKNLIAVIRSAPAPIDVVWFVEQMDARRAEYNARVKAERDEYQRRLLAAKDPVIEAVKMIFTVVERGAGKLVDGIKFPFVYVANAPPGSGGTYSSLGLGPGGYRSPKMGPTYYYLKGIAASGGVIPLH